MFDENSNATAAATLVGPAGTNTALHTNNLNSTHLFNQLLNVKDSRWLQLEVCREFQRGQCSRSEMDCRFAHPPPHVEVQNGRVTACYDSIKGRCTRENPKCKYLHPPQHLKDQLLVNGRNNLAIKNLICSQLTQPAAVPNLQMAQLMQQNQSAGLHAQLPYQYYSTPLTAIYPLLPAADFQTLSPVAQQLAILQNQQKPQQVAQVPGASLPLTNSALASLQLQQLAQQQAALQSQLYASTNPTSPPLSNPTLASFQLQQQAALLAALSAQQQAVSQQSQVQTPATLTDNRKRTARTVGFDDGSTDEKKSAVVSSSSSTSAPVLPIITPNGADHALQQQLLLLNAAASSNTVSTGLPNGKRHLDKNGLPANGHAIPIYAAQQPTGPQFGPYIGYAPVSYSGQIPPRF